MATAWGAISGRGPKAMSSGSLLGQGLKFLVVGGGASFLYFGLALLFDRGVGFGPVASSTLAYALAAVFSYVGHKLFTFNSKGGSKFEALRFTISTLIGFSLASFIPFALSQFAPIISYLAVLAVVPVISFLMLKFFVFSKD